MSVRTEKTQISLGICPVWSGSSLSAWRKLGSLATHWVHSEDSDQTGRMPRLIWVFAGRTLTLLVLSCRGSRLFDFCFQILLPDFQWDSRLKGMILGSFFYGYIFTQLPGGKTSALYMSQMHLLMFPPVGWDTLGIRPTKNHFHREFDRTLWHRDGTLVTLRLKFSKKLYRQLSLTRLCITRYYHIRRSDSPVPTFFPIYLLQFDCA